MKAPREVFVAAEPGHRRVPKTEVREYDIGSQPLTFGIEYNIGEKTSKYEGAIDTGSEVVSSLEKSRMAQRISFGLFFDF